MRKEFYPCDRKEIENILFENNYFNKEGNTLRKLIHRKYCTHITRNKDICLTKIKDENQIYCKHHIRKSIIILCSYNNCNNKCKLYGDFCHKHRKYYSNNINCISYDIFNYDIFSKYNYTNEWERYTRWYSYTENNRLSNRKIVIKDYIGGSKYTNYNYEVIKYTNYRDYINNILINIYRYIEKYCITNKISQTVFISILNLFYNIYKTSCFENFDKKYNKNNINCNNLVKKKK